MSDITSAYSDTIRFRLSATNVDSLVLLTEPIGWKDDSLELDRHKDYHGIFTSFTNNLEFINEAKEYIERAYDNGGINENLILTKEILVEDGDDLVFKTRYTAIADFSTMVKTQTRVTIKFNSNNLAELIKSHESDDFEIESSDPDKPLTSIDGKTLDTLVLDTTEIKGRSILVSGESIGIGGVYNGWGTSRKNNTLITELISEGLPRHQAVVFGSYNKDDLSGSLPVTSDNLIYTNVTSSESVKKITLDVDLNFEVYDCDTFLSVNFYKVRFYPGSDVYSIIETKNIFYINYAPDFDGFGFYNGKYSIQDSFETDVTWEDGIMVGFVFGGTHNLDVGGYYPPTGILSFSTVFKPLLVNRFKINEVAYFDSSPNLDVIFNHDLSKRLLYIITGRNTAYYSKYFGRTELGYIQDGESGLIGVMSGLWARAFDRKSEKYKALTISLKDQMESNRAVFNTGIGIETINLQERVREEDLRYFYQNEVVVRLPNQIKDVKRTVDNDLFFSGMSFGYDKAGDYEDSMGLDEPNTRTDYVTPIRKSTKKYQKISKIRADEYGMEFARRKPQSTFPLEDTKYDDSNWFLDLKRVDDFGYEQRESYTDGLDINDRLKVPATGIYSPETFRSSFFTPLRMLMRHAWVFRSGLEKYLGKDIKYISKDKNSTLETHAQEYWNQAKDKAYSESDDILVGDLNRSRFLPEIVEFEHPVDDELMEWINGKTELEYPEGSGMIENVPNVYFKFEYQNENGILERGYLLNLKPNKEGKWQMQLSNENIIA